MFKVFFFFTKINLLKYCFLLLLLGSEYSASFAQGDLMIYPKRLVFNGSQRSQDLTLINTGQDTARYSISMINYRMTENGDFLDISTPDSGQHFADDHIRLFPRNVTLAPNEAQKVKAQVYKANQLNEGEYRSHIYFRPVKDREPLEEKVIEKNPEGITTNLYINFGISIPVIIEVGNSPVMASLSNISLDEKEQDSPRLSFTIHRKGNYSVYGDFRVVHIDSSSKATDVGIVKGVAVYTPISKRHFSIVLLPGKGIDYSNGKLTLEYHPQDATAKKLAFGELMLN